MFPNYINDAVDAKDLKARIAALESALADMHECCVTYTYTCKDGHEETETLSLDQIADTICEYRFRAEAAEAALAAKTEECERPIVLAIYTTDDGRITSVVERDADGDPVDREIDATAVISHVDGIVGRLTNVTEVLVQNNIKAAGNAIELAVLRPRADDAGRVKREMPESFVELVREAMGAEWNEYVNDCHAHPNEFEIRGNGNNKTLWADFIGRGGNWSRWVAEIIWRDARAVLAAADGERREP